MSVTTARTNIIGLTGGIASGKTAATNYLTSHGYYVIDSDKIVEDIWNDDLFIKQISANMGIKITVNDKKLIFKIIQENLDQKKILEKTIHPLVFKKIDELIESNLQYKTIIIDMPLLFEVGYDQFCSLTILIDVNEKNQIKRLMKRDSLSEVDAVKRISLQMPLDQKRVLADLVVDNNGKLSFMYQQLEQIFRNIEV